MITLYATVDVDSVRPYMPDVPYLLPASSFARRRDARGELRPVRLPPHVTETAADSGGYVATRIHGDYTYTPAQYVRWLRSFAPAWAATMDYCCEEEITGGAGVHNRQARTTEMARLFWETYPAEPWCWVPTVQGWEVGDYRRHARELAPLVADMAGHYGAGSAFRVGIGTLCRRADTETIHAVAQAVAAELPGVSLHLWGIKLGALKHREALPEAVVSTDSAAWNGFFGVGHEDWKASGMTKREYQYHAALPQYLAKVGAALAGPKQGRLF